MRFEALRAGGPPAVVEAGGARDPDPRAATAAFLGRRDLLRGRLLEAGALLLRGLPALEPEEFAGFVREFARGRLLDYAGGASPRVRLGAGVYTSTEYPRTVSLSLHNELSYTYRRPSLLFFHCVTPAETGGETPLADSRAILKKIDPRVVRRFKERGVRYVRNLPGRAGTGYSWREAFETEDRSEVEAYCRAGGVRFE
jgi:alpha-ketoglutarate-dependent taurine dioxygenase